MRLPVVPRSELELVRAERDEWRRRATSVLREGHRAVSATRPTRRRMWARRTRPLLAAGVLAAAVAAGSLTLPTRTDGAAGPDYPGCIGKARYEAPVDGNQYQELVNALYACGVYQGP